MSTSTIAKVTAYTDVLDALRDVHDEASLWRLADELAKVAPSGVTAVENVVSAAKAAGIPTKSANTLRLYRDVAKTWPAAERVAGVSFSAHREALGGYNGDVSKAKQVLLDLQKQHTSAGVTVTTVKKAVGAATGNVAKATGKAPVAPPTTYGDVAVDLQHNQGKAFIKELPAMLAIKGVDLDGLHAGLTAVLGQVEAMRVKAARKAAQAKKPVAPVKAAVKPTAKPITNGKPAAGKPRVKAAGDLRGL